MGISAQHLTRPIRRVSAHNQDPQPYAYLLPGYTQSRAGEAVNEETALSYTPFLRACAIISQTIAKLPKIVKRQISAKQYEDLPTHPVSLLLSRRPNDEMTAFTFWVCMILWMLRWGNAYAEIVYSLDGKTITGIWPLEAWRVTPRRTSDTNELYYEVWNPDGGHAALSRRRVFHLSQLALDGVLGLGYVAAGRNAIGYGMACENTGADFFQNGAMPGGIVSNPQAMPKEEAQIEEMKRKFKASFSGRKRGEVAILFGGTTFTAASVPNNQAQYHETREFQVLEVARLTGVPPFMLMDYKNAPYSTPEHQRIQFHDSCLSPLVSLICAEGDAKLLDDTGPLYIVFDTSEILMGDTKTRGEYYKNLVTGGILSPNEARAKLGENPSGDPASDTFYAPVNLAPLSTLGSLSAEDRALSGAMTEGGNPDTSKNVSAHRPAMARAIERIAARESKKRAALAKTLDGDALDAALTEWRGQAAQRDAIAADLAPTIEGAYLSIGRNATEAHALALAMAARFEWRDGGDIDAACAALETEITQ